MGKIFTRFLCELCINLNPGNISKLYGTKREILVVLTPVKPLFSKFYYFESSHYANCKEVFSPETKIYNCLKNGIRDAHTKCQPFSPYGIQEVA